MSQDTSKIKWSVWNGDTQDSQTHTQTHTHRHTHKHRDKYTRAQDWTESHISIWLINLMTFLPRTTTRTYFWRVSWLVPSHMTDSGKCVMADWLLIWLRYLTFENGVQSICMCFLNDNIHEKMKTLDGNRQVTSTFHPVQVVSMFIGCSVPSAQTTANRWQDFLKTREI